MPSGEAWVAVLNNLLCHVWDVKDGKVTRFQQYVDTAKLQDVMGTR